MNKLDEIGGEFPDTSWTLILRAKSSDSVVSRSALEELCGKYWPPLYVYARKKGYSEADAEDLTQEFMSHFVHRGDFGKVDSESGKLRSYLLKSYKNFMISDFRKKQRQKRGGGAISVSIDAVEGEALFELMQSDDCSAGKTFDRVWATTIINKVLGSMGQTYDEKGKGRTFALLRPCLTTTREHSSYTELAEELGSTEAAVRKAVRRLRREFGVNLRKAVKDTLSDDESVEEELEALKIILGDQN